MCYMPHTSLTHTHHTRLTHASTHASYAPHTHTQTHTHTHTHTHTLRMHSAFTHLLSTCSSQALSPSCPSLLLTLQKQEEIRALYIQWQTKFKRIRESHKESRITIVPQCFHLPYSQASGRSNNNCKLIIVETLNFNLFT